MWGPKIRVKTQIRGTSPELKVQWEKGEDEIQQKRKKGESSVRTWQNREKTNDYAPLLWKTKCSLSVSPCILSTIVKPRTPEQAVFAEEEKKKKD